MSRTPSPMCWENLATFFPMSRTVEPGDSADGWTTSKLFSTTAGSFATEDFEVVEGELRRNPDKETEGPISVGVAATFEAPTEAPSGDAENEDGEGDEADVAASDDDEEEEEGKQGRVVVVGTSVFARNNFLRRGSNLDLFLNILNWLSLGRRPHLDSPRRTPTTRRSTFRAPLCRGYFS